MSIFSSHSIPFLDNVPATLHLEFLKAHEGYSSRASYDAK